MIKHLITQITLLAFLCSNLAWAGLPPTTLKDVSGVNGGTTFNFKTYTNQTTSLGGTTNLLENSSHNLLQDPSFEGTSIANKWTAVTVTPTLDTLNTYPDGGKQSAKLAPSSQTFSLSQSISNIPNGQFGSINLEASCKVKTTVSGVQLCPISGGTTLTSQCVNVPTDGNWDYVPVNFVGTASQAPGIIIQAASAVTGTINVDDCYVGVARNIGTVAQAQLFGQVKITGCSGNWSSSSTSFASYSAQTSCVYTATGNASAPATMIPAITFSSMPAGFYKLEYEGSAIAGTASDASYFQFSDGTNTANEISEIAAVSAQSYTSGFKQSILYSSPQSNVTLQIKTKVDSGGSSILSGTTAAPGVISVYYFPTSAQGAVAANQQTQPTIQKFLSGSGTYTTPAGVTRIEVKMVGGGGGGGGDSGTNAGGTGGNTTFGTSLLVANGGAGGSGNNGGIGGTASLGSGPIGIALQGGTGMGVAQASGVFATGGSGASSPFGGSGASNLNSSGVAAIPNTGAGGGGAGPDSVSGHKGGAGGGAGGYVSAIITSPAATYSYSVGSSGAAGAAGALGFTGGAGGSGIIEVTEYYQGQNAPILNNSITTNASGAWRVETYRLNGSGSSYSMNKTTDTGATSARSATGKATITFGTAFSSAPICAASVNYNAGASVYQAVIDTATGAASTTQVFIASLTTVYADSDGFNVTCMGPR